MRLLIGFNIWDTTKTTTLAQGSVSFASSDIRIHLAVANMGLGIYTGFTCTLNRAMALEASSSAKVQSVDLPDSLMSHNSTQ
jgi:hypothetical protein